MWWRCGEYNGQPNALGRVRNVHHTVPSRLCPEEPLTHESAKKIPAQTIGPVWCGAVTAHWIYASATLLTAFV